MLFLAKFLRMSLLTVGTMAIDSIETPFGSADQIVGGSCQYISYAAAYFIDRINLVAVAGDDFPQNELTDLQKRGVSLEGLKILQGEKSFYWAGRYHDNMNDRDTLVTDLNVLAEFDPVLPDSYKDSPFVLLGNLTPDIQIRVIEQMRTKPKLVVLDTMNYWIENTWQDLAKAISLCNVLTINDEEARMISGKHSLVKAAADILELGPTYLIIKKGEHGALLFDKNNVFFAPALPLENVVDPTGAGDTFAGGLLGYLAKTGDVSFENIKRGLIYGSAMASFVVEDFGNRRLKSLTSQEIEDRIAKFIRLTHFEL